LHFGRARILVTVVEKNEWLGRQGGSARRSRLPIRHGADNSDDSFGVERVFAEAGRTLSDYLDMVRLDPQWRCFFEDRTQFDLVESLPEMMNRLNDFTGSDRTSRGYEKFMAISKQLDEVSNRFFFWKSVGGIGDTMDVKQSFSLNVLRDVLSLRFGRTVAGLVRSHIPDLVSRR
jgi:diapolycopene oxygenase